MDALQEFNELDGVEVNKKYLLFISSELQKLGHYDEARRAAFSASQLKGDEIVTIQLTPNGLSGKSDTDLIKNALDGCGRLKKGFKFLKGGEIVEVISKQKNSLSDLYKEFRARIKEALNYYNFPPAITRKYKLGDKYRSDFDYKGMLEKGLKINEKTPTSTIKKLFDSMADVNFHTESAPLWQIYLLRENRTSIKDATEAIFNNKQKAGLSGSDILEIYSNFCEKPTYITDSDCPYTGLNKQVSTDDIYQYITDLMVNTIEDVGHLPWQRKWDKTLTLWDGKQALNFESKKPYRGINFWMVNFKPKYDAKEDKWYLVPRDLTNPYFLTFNQIEKNKGTLKKGSKATRVYYFTKLYIFKEQQKDGKTLEFSSYKLSKVVSWILKNKNKITSLKDNKPEDLIRYLPILKYYNVFHGADVDGIDWPDVPGTIQKPKSKIERIAIAETIVRQMPNAPEILYKGNQPAYYPSFDHIRMTPIDAFESAEEYYSTLFHELIHATGHKSRLSRPGITLGKLATKIDYAKEELVAEMGAVFLSSEAGILHKIKDNSAKYLAGWNRRLVKNMKKDNKFFFRSSSQAQAAADYILDRDSEGVPAYQASLIKNNPAKEKATPKPKQKNNSSAAKNEVRQKVETSKDVGKKAEKNKVPTKKPAKSLPLQINYPISQIETRNSPNNEKVEDILADFDLNKIAPIKVYENPDKRSVTLVEGIDRLEAIRRLNFDNAPVVYVPEPKAPKRKSPKQKEQLELFDALNGSKNLIKASDIEAMDFEMLDLDEGWENLFQDAPADMKLGIFAQPKNGKTAGSTKLAAYLTKFGPVLYNFADQGINFSTKKLIKLSGLGKKGGVVTASNTLKDLHKDIQALNPRYCFIDMINDYIRLTGIKPHEFKRDFIQKYPNTSFSLIFEVTKNGQFKGDNGWMHLVDNIIEIEDFIMTSKGRYGNGNYIIWAEEAKKRQPDLYDQITKTSDNENQKSPPKSDWLQLK